MTQDVKDQLQSQYALVLLDTAILFEYTNGTWEVCPIYDEKTNSLRDDNAAANIARELDTHINATSQLRDIELMVIYDKEASSQIPNLSTSLLELQSVSWQLFSWQFVIQKLNNTNNELQINTMKSDITWLSQSLLPVINSLGSKDIETDIESEDYEDSQEGTAIERIELEKARESNRELQHKVQRLQHQANALQGLSIHKIITFMPAIYQNFWHVVKPSDIGLLVGNYAMPEIPSPFPEPAIDTIHMMKKQFLALPKQDQQQIIEFCQQLTYPLSIRQEFKALMA